MQITTPTVDTLTTLNVDLLASVSGGCHKGNCCQQSVVNNNNIVIPPAAAAVPQAPAPVAPPAPAYDPGPQVSTSVSINGQPAA